MLRHYQELETQARAELAAEGITADQIRFERQVDLKYGYQVAELSLPFPDVSVADMQDRLAQLFTEAHRQAFGYDRADTIELVSVRLRAIASLRPSTPYRVDWNREHPYVSGLPHGVFRSPGRRMPGRGISAYRS